MLIIAIALIVFGIITIAAGGLLFNVIGTAICALGGAAAYIILAHRRDRRRAAASWRWR